MFVFSALHAYFNLCLQNLAAQGTPHTSNVYYDTYLTIDWIAFDWSTRSVDFPLSDDRINDKGLWNWGGSTSGKKGINRSFQKTTTNFQTAPIFLTLSAFLDNNPQSYGVTTWGDGICFYCNPTSLRRAIHRSDGTSFANSHDLYSIYMAVNPTNPPFDDSRIGRFNVETTWGGSNTAFCYWIPYAEPIPFRRPATLLMDVDHDAANRGSNSQSRHKWVEGVTNLGFYACVRTHNDSPNSSFNNRLDMHFSYLAVLLPIVRWNSPIAIPTAPVCAELTSLDLAFYEYSYIDLDVSASHAGYPIYITTEVTAG